MQRRIRTVVVQLVTHLPLGLQALPPVHSGTSSVPMTATQEPLPQAMQGVVQLELQHTPSAQKPDLHCPGELQSCPFGRFEGAGPHAPTPLHVLPPWHSPSGSLPAGYPWQVPFELGWLHERHGPTQALVQHTPSAQAPEAHSWLLSHDAPCRLPHASPHPGLFVASAATSGAPSEAASAPTPSSAALPSGLGSARVLVPSSARSDPRSAPWSRAAS